MHLALLFSLTPEGGKKSSRKRRAMNPENNQKQQLIDAYDEMIFLLVTISLESKKLAKKFMKESLKTMEEKNERFHKN
jgi:hypothetical protein